MHIKTLSRLVARRLRLDEASCHFLLLLSVSFVEDSHWFVRFRGDGLCVALRATQLLRLKIQLRLGPIAWIGQQVAQLAPSLSKTVVLISPLFEFLHVTIEEIVLCMPLKLSDKLVLEGKCPVK